MTPSRLCGSNQAIGKTPADRAGVAELLTNVFCDCGEEVGFRIGTMACELFRRVDLAGQPTRKAAQALGLDPRDAAAILDLVRRNIADALVHSMSAPPIRTPRDRDGLQAAPPDG